MDFRNEPFFDNHTHLLNMAKSEIVPAELALNFLHGYRDEVDEDGTSVASAEWVGHVSELGVVKTLVSFLTRYLNCEATLEAVVEARNRAARDDYAAYIKGLYQDQNILAEVLDSELPIDSPKISCFPVKVLRLFRYEDVYFSLLKTEDSFAILWDKLEQAIRQAVAEGFVGLKGHVGEKFTMAVREVTPEQAEAAFAAAKAGDRQACEQVLLENKTQLDLMFSLRGVSVNGYMCDPFFAATVSAGMKSNEEISFLKSDLAANGITEVTDITFTLAVYDSTDILAEYLMEEEFTVYPQGEEAQRTYERQSAQTDVVLVSNEDCAIIVTGFEPDSTWGYAMGVYLENRTDEALMFSASDVAVNGYMCDPYWAVEVAPGKRCNCQITWSKTDLADNGITQVEKITLPIRVYDSDDWLEGEILSETFTITP